MEEFNSTILGYQNDQEMKHENLSHWDIKQFDYYRKLYTEEIEANYCSKMNSVTKKMENITINKFLEFDVASREGWTPLWEENWTDPNSIPQPNTTLIKAARSHAARGPKNFDSEPAIFYFLFDPMDVADIFKNEFEKNETGDFIDPLLDEGERCHHVLKYEKKYQIRDCCHSRPPNGSALASEDVIKTMSSRSDHGGYFLQWNTELFTKNEWAVDFRDWIYENVG